MREPLKASDLARLCNVTSRTIQNWVRLYDLPAQRTAGGHLRFDGIEVLNWMYAHDMAIPSKLKESV